jgi:hypothetical protein
MNCLHAKSSSIEWVTFELIPNSFENNIFGQWGRKVQTSYKVVERVYP